MDTVEQRSLRRKREMVVNRAANFEEAESWDLDFWQSLTPQDRLSALVAIRRDVAAAQAAKANGSKKD